MTWQELKNLLLASPTYQELPAEFRQQTEERLPTCDAEQLADLQLILAEDQQNVQRFVEESKQFKKDIGKKILGLEELLSHQEEIDDLDATMANL